MTDLLITGGLVLDGSGAPGVRADVAVDDGRIVAVGNDLPAAARRTIDADGLVLAPQGRVDLGECVLRLRIERPRFVLGRSHRIDDAVVSDRAAARRGRAGIALDHGGLLGGCGREPY